MCGSHLFEGCEQAYAEALMQPKGYKPCHPCVYLALRPVGFDLDRVARSDRNEVIADVDIALLVPFGLRVGRSPMEKPEEAFYGDVGGFVCVFQVVFLVVDLDGSDDSEIRPWYI